jgi:hypothetical protein
LFLHFFFFKFKHDRINSSWWNIFVFEC